MFRSNDRYSVEGVSVWGCPPVRTISAAIAQRASSSSTEAQAMALAACRGKNGFTSCYRFGPQTAMNSCNTQALIDGITLAAGPAAGLTPRASALTELRGGARSPGVPDRRPPRWSQFRPLWWVRIDLTRPPDHEGRRWESGSVDARSLITVAVIVVATGSLLAFAPCIHRGTRRRW